MSSTDQTVPRQIRLPGQVAAPDGPIDMYAMYLMHHAFRRDLARFVKAVARTPTDDRRTWRRLADRWEVFAGALHEHHSSEDDHIWPFLAGRADDAERRVLDAMEAEHAEIDPLLEACRAGFERLRGGGTAADRDALHRKALAAQERLCRHLGHEESDAIALIQRTVSKEEWQELEKELQKDATLRSVLAVVPWSMHEVPRAVREHAFAGAGGWVFRLLWLLTRRRFALRERRAFRYA